MGVRLPAKPEPSGGRLDIPSFDQLYREHASSVHRFCLSQVGSATTAEDLTHDTFLRAVAGLDRRRPDLALRPWLLTIARNLSVDHHRRHGRWRALAGRLGSAPQPHGSVELVAEHRDRLLHVQAEIDRLKRRDRELIGLRVAADLSFREIADVLGISEASAKVATHRALTRLRARLENEP